jgi:two-component system cell cycle sensor histidine kinase/response regulator CckA
LILTQYRQNKTVERLQSSEQRYRSLFESNLAGVFCTTPDGKYLDCNEAFARMFGYESREEVLASNASALYAEPAERAERLARIREQRSFTNMEVHRRRKDGSLIWALQNVTLMEDAQGNEFIEGTIVDITERKRLEEQLRQSQKMEAVGRLAGGLAHDFNNLLTVIKGYSRMVLDEPRRKREEESFREIVQHIDSAADRAAALTRHLLAFSRKQVLQPRVIDLNALMVNLDKMLRRLIGEDIAVVTVAAPGLGSLKADPGQIELVIMNLVVNARDAMPKGGKLTLETANVELDAEYARDHDGVEAGRYVMLAVSDTGAGMDAQTLALIFEPFFTTKELGRGTGLGLSTVYGIVKQSGGHIWVYSEPGRGTTFKIYLARVDEPAERLPRLTVSANTVRGTETILLVEDNEQVRELTHAVLASRGYSVLVAENGPAVQKICAQHKEDIDLLLTDVVMPGVSGREVAKLVTARWPGVKVLFMSGYTENSIIHHGVLDDGTFFLAKPFNPSALTNKVREVLDHRTWTR